MIRLAYLKTLIRYDPENGVLMWLKNTPHRIKGSTERKGKLAGRCGGLSIDGQYYQTKRIAWYLYYGELPLSHIKHLDDNKSNIRIKNLYDSGARRRRCTACPTEGGKELFYADPRAVSGMQSICKKCRDAKTKAAYVPAIKAPVRVIPPPSPVFMPRIVRRSLGMED